MAVPRGLFLRIAGVRKASCLCHSGLTICKCSSQPHSPRPKSRQVTSSACRSVNIIKLTVTAPRRPHRPPRGGGFSLFLGANAPRQLCQLPLCFFEGKSRTLAPCRQSNKARFMQTALERIKGIEQQGTALQLRGSRQTVYKARFAGSLA